MPARSRSTIAAALVAVAMTACSSGSSPSPGSQLGSIHTATVAGGSGTTRGRLTAVGHGGRLTGQWTGASVASGSGEVSVALSETATVRLRWAEGKLYAGGTGALQGLLPGLLASYVDLTDPARWRAIPTSPYTTTLVTPFSPPELVGLLQRQHVRVQSARGPKIVGVATSHLTVKSRLGLLFVWSNPKVELWTDARDRVVRIRLTAGNDSMQYDVTYRSVPSVSTPQDTSVPTTVPTHFTAVGPYSTVASGQSGALAWKVLRAPGTDSSQCWRVETVPAVVVRAPNADDGARCFLPVPADADPQDEIQFAIVTDGQTPGAVLVARVPQGSTAQIGFVGSTATVPATVVGDAVVWAGPVDPAPGYLGVTLPDGTKVDCGVGGIATAGDLTDSSLAPDPYGLAWGCTPP
ncbi:MAG: hypothetical protein ACXV8Y_00795 [Acidimicrobiia bacterium]